MDGSSNKNAVDLDQPAPAPLPHPRRKQQQIEAKLKELGMEALEERLQSSVQVAGSASGGVHCDGGHIRVAYFGASKLASKLPRMVVEQQGSQVWAACHSLLAAGVYQWQMRQQQLQLSLHGRQTKAWDQLWS
jgi:hypothetical protein